MGSLEILSEDGGLVLARGWREGEGGGKDVLIVLPASEQPTQTILDRIAHEYSFKDELDSTWAVLPLELTRDRGGKLILVLEDPGGELLGGLLGTPMEVGLFLRLAVGVAAAVFNQERARQIRADVQTQLDELGRRVDDLTSQATRVMEEKRPDIENTIAKGKQAVVDGLEKARSAVEQSADKAQEYVQKTAKDVPDQAEQAGDAMKDAADTVGDNVSGAVDDVQMAADDVRMSAEDAVDSIDTNAGAETRDLNLNGNGTGSGSGEY